ncbi:hypothetical protein BTJ39_20445 [Izhakiella australiensis]|uniref:Uncharacterized protein n=1 Tax=Izhakiella australiensis TaxID=1926881 RepID=A0A1S8YE96_9GAMM|nr:hypothetical protein BTJ39_20445 [Izhakiella australiensis]
MSIVFDSVVGQLLAPAFQKNKHFLHYFFKKIPIFIGSMTPVMNVTAFMRYADNLIDFFFATFDK